MAKKNGAYKIERGVEKPPHWRQKYPWPEMSAGDSVLIPCDETKYAVNVVRKAATDWLARNRPDLQCTVHKVEGGARVWVEEAS